LQRQKQGFDLSNTTRAVLEKYGMTGLPDD